MIDGLKSRPPWLLGPFPFLETTAVLWSKMCLFLIGQEAKQVAGLMTIVLPIQGEPFNAGARSNGSHALSSWRLRSCYLPYYPNPS